VSASPLIARPLTAILSTIPGVENQCIAQYVQLDHALTPKISLVSRIDYGYTQDAPMSSTTDSMLGVRWSPRLDTLLQLEYHYVDGNFLGELS
jgi:hypothetical protein